MISIRRLNLTGKRFGRLTVVEYYDSKNGNARWRCLCDCGKEKIAYSGGLTRGTTQSCGCLHREMVSVTHKKFNKYDLSGEFGIGYTTNTGASFYFDKEDYEQIKDYAWLENDQGYIISRNANGNTSTIRMHRLIMNVPEDVIVDHKNLKRYDNRKCNLRSANKQLNGINRPHNINNPVGIKGVEKYRNDKYIARICVDGKNIHLGIFDNIEDAQKARESKEIELFGEFAYKGDNV